MPKLVNINGQPMIEIKRDEVFNFYLGMGRGEEYAKKMTKSLMSTSDNIAFSKTVEWYKDTEPSSFTQEVFLKSYLTSLVGDKS